MPNAAEALFVSEGYELTSVDAIAARADVSIGGRSRRGPRKGGTCATR
ncbi:TetR family transcriptional regulator [Spongiactinospora sp. 9N601]